jgi:hypothetical protein
MAGRRSGRCTRVHPHREHRRDLYIASGMNTDDLHESFFVIELNVMDRVIGAAAVLLNATRGI